MFEFIYLSVLRRNTCKIGNWRKKERRKYEESGRQPNEESHTVSQVCTDSRLCVCLHVPLNSLLSVSKNALACNGSAGQRILSKIDMSWEDTKWPATAASTPLCSTGRKEIKNVFLGILECIHYFWSALQGYSKRVESNSGSPTKKSRKNSLG